MKVKICGMTNASDALFCAGQGADELGFIFYDRSPRYIAPEAAAEIIAGLPPYVTPVGVFVNETRGRIEQAIALSGIRSLQLSGDESAADCAGFGLPVIKAFRFKDPSETLRAREYAIAAAMLDGQRDGLFGGSGVMADTTVALALKTFHPLYLAGGLTPDTVVRAARSVLPFAVDVNSGVELSPGVKDHARVALLFERLRHHHDSLH